MLRATNSAIFFSRDFSVSLNFCENGALLGVLRPFAKVPDLQIPFKGIYLADGSKIKIGFFIDRNDPNIIGNVLTCYSGVIFRNFENNECMCLKWLLLNESLTTVGTYVENHIDVLFDSVDKYHSFETRKIDHHIPIDVFEF